MRRTGRRLGLVIAVSATLVVLGVAAPAAADQPSMTRVFFDDDTIEDFTCGFLIVEEFDGRVDITVFVDGDGNPTRIRVAALFQGTLTNPETGESIRGDQELILFFPADGSEETWAGLRFRAVFPGAGAVLLDVGRISFDPATGEVFFEAGPHQVFHEDFEAYCAEFSS